MFISCGMWGISFNIIALRSVVFPTPFLPIRPYFFPGINLKWEFYNSCFPPILKE